MKAPFFTPKPIVTDDWPTVGPTEPETKAMPATETFSSTQEVEAETTPETYAKIAQDMDLEQTGESQRAETAEGDKQASTKVEKGDAMAITTPNSTTDTSDPFAPEDAPKYPRGGALILLTLGLCLGTFTLALDSTILATAIPQITTVFDSLDDIGWYASAYLLTTASLQPSFGKVYTFFHVKVTFVSSIAIFELGSVLCGAATSSNMLIVGRAVAGVGASGIFSGAMTIIGYSVPLQKRPIYIAAVSSMFGIASVVGPILGGAFTSRVSWRWCFYINLPIGAVCIALVMLFFKDSECQEGKLTVKQKLLELDILGAVFLIGAIVCLLIALQYGGSIFPWSNSRVWGCFIGFGLLFSIFAAIQFRRGDRATLPPRILLHQRTVIAVALFSFFLSLGNLVCIYWMPVWFQAIKGVSAQESGIRLVPFLVTNFLFAIPVGALVSKIGYYTPFIWFGSMLFPVGTGLLHLLKVDSGAAQWIGYQILSGAATGICLQLPFIAVQVVLDKTDMPIGNAITIFFNTMGGAVGTSIAQTVFDNVIVRQIPRHTTGVNVEAIIAAGATDFRQVTPPKQLAGLLLAYNISVTDTFLVAVGAGGVAFLCSFLFEIKSVKGKNLIPRGASE